MSGVTGLLCPAAAGGACIRVQDGTFTWSRESPPCLHRYRRAALVTTFLLSGRKCKRHPPFLCERWGGFPAWGWRVGEPGLLFSGETPGIVPGRESPGKARASADGGMGHLSLPMSEETPRCFPGWSRPHEGGLAKKSLKAEPHQPCPLLSLLCQSLGHCHLHPLTLWLGLCSRKPQPTPKLPVKGTKTPWAVSVSIVIHSLHSIYRPVALCQGLF